MHSTDGDILFRSTLAASLSVGIAMLAVLAVGLWGASRDLSDLRAALLRAEIGRHRSHGIRTVTRLESELERAAAASDLTSLRETEWLQRYWNRVIPHEQQRLYATVVSTRGQVIVHSDESLIGERLAENWQTAPVLSNSGSGDVFLTRSRALSGGLPAFDIAIPIELNSRIAGYYHSGFDQLWFDEQVSLSQRPVRNRWFLIISAIFIVVLLAAVSVHRINRHYAALQQAVRMSHVKQLSDLGRLVGALAHEIRNPLNAIRLNLHALRNVLLDHATLEEDEIQQVVEESNREIERLSELMKTMLGYARPDQPVGEHVELNTEVEAIAGFLAPIMDRDEIDFTTVVPDAAVVVTIDSDRLRQVLLNLVNNAREAAGPGGRIILRLDAVGSHAQITVSDSGPGIPAAERDRIFDAFYSTRDNGTGLGLALVKRFVEEAGGVVECEDDTSDGGAMFRVTLPQYLPPEFPADENATAAAGVG